VPSDWRLVRLAEVSSECSARNRNLEFGRDDVLSVDNQLGLIPSDRNLGDDFSRYKVVDNLAFAYNPMRLNVGSIGLWEARHAAIVSPDYIVFRCKPEEAAAEFLNEFRKSAAWKQQIEQSGQGSIRIRYYYRHISEFLVPLPPLAEQRAIAHVLRTVQRAKEATEKVLAATKQLKQSLLHRLFTYGPVPFDQADQVELKETEDGPMPKAWAVRRLGDIATLSTGTTPSTAQPEYYDGPVPFIKTGQIANNVINRPDTTISQKAVEDYSLRLYPPGTVFMAMYGQGKTRGQVALLGIEATTTQNTAAIVPGVDVVPEFLWLYLMSTYELLREKGFHGQISHLNLGYVRELAIPLATIPEQRIVASAVLKVQRKFEAELARHQALTTLFNTLLHHLMTGKVRVV